MEQNALPDYLSALNETQRNAVYHTGRPLLILAGAGSGKTRVITTKIAYFIREKNVKPWSILAVTFTNKAAKEMASRAALIEPDSENSMIRTFHSFGAWFLRRNAEAAKLNSNFIIYDDDDVVSLLSSVIDKKKDELRLIAAYIARAKDRNIGPDSEELPIINHTKEFRAIYAKYEERMRQTGNVDFGDLIKKPIEILRQQPEIAERIQDRFSVIMVDEYQDANVAQFELLKKITSAGSYLCVVGDDDQSIYRFRGAEVQNILCFSDMFGGADIIKLEKNYRSTREILDLANSVVKNNKGRHGKKLEAVRGSGKLPCLYFLDNQEREAEVCADLIKTSIRQKETRYSDWAILYRTNAQSLGFENEFIHRKIPYRIVGSLKFYEREEIKDALALLSFMVNPKDEVSFRRVVNKPARGIGEITINKILKERWNEHDWDIEATLKKTASTFSAKARSGIETFLSAIKTGRSALEGGIKKMDNKTVLRFADGLSICVAQLIESSGIAAYHRDHDEVSGEQRIANLQELINSAVLYKCDNDGLLEFLEHIELDRTITQQNDSDDRVTLITLHNTKGLEYKCVIMTGLEQGLFPRTDKKDNDLEEERRLFYVGVTRAMNELYLTSCAVRRVWGQISFMEPSLFLREADMSCVKINGEIPHRFGAQKNIILNTDTFHSHIRYKTSSDGRWRIGDRVFNDDHGYGELCEIKETEDGPVIKVLFETGRSIKFLSKAQSKHYMKIKD
ncbi:MAG: ATP-dependent helicase [Spirochaetaceae bacterium]|jgi:DNA helicase-2/ATP-dependent DNA helicase PcrA|nr:ATP-dependent helicase [Spirochaetaceae bacterium]